MKRILLILALVGLFTVPSFAGDFWGNLSLDYGFPYNPVGSADLIGNLTTGYTPLHIVDALSFGLLMRESMGVAVVNLGEVSYGNVTNESYSFETWATISPMIAMRTSLGSDCYFTLATGVGYNLYATNPDKNVGTWSETFLAQIQFNYFILESGIEGPDGFVGIGLNL
jgi:hypothetical protein